MPTVLCGIGAGIGYDCTSKRLVSGVKKVWLFNIDQLRTAIDPNGTGYVRGLEFTGYDGLYLFDAGKYSHSATSPVIKVADSGAVSFGQTVTLRLLPDDPTELATLSDLLVSVVGAVVLTNNNEFRIYGAINGMEITEGEVNPTGRAQGENTVTTITLGGEERLPYRILLHTDGTYASTLALVEAYVF